MTSLIPTFLSNLEQLENNQVPKTNSGKPFRKLRYKGEKHEKLTDEDVKRLSKALECNLFEGAINLSKNDLTDLSALYLASSLKKFTGLRQLDLSDNNLRSKAGEYIGDALAENPDYNISQISFKNNRLEEYGLRRLIYAATKNSNIKDLNIGIISDFGLELLSAELLNTSLIRLSFTEDEEKPFSEKAKDEFINTLKTGIEFSEGFSLEEAGTIQKVKAKLINKDERIDYFCDMRKDQFQNHKKYKKRNKALAQKSLVKKIIKHIEGKKAPEKIAVKKYFRNTFGDLLNDAMYELTRKQEKFPDEKIYFTVEG